MPYFFINYEMLIRKIKRHLAFLLKIIILDIFYIYCITAILHCKTM